MNTTKNNQYELSVIVPVYNTEVELFESCLKSIKNQKTKIKYEIIIIDDGSTNPEIYKVLAEKYQASYFFQKNGGVSSARNAGIERSKGEYILFIDADDYLASDYIEKTMHIVKKDDVDVLICGHTVQENGNETAWNPEEKHQCSRDDIAIDMILKNHFYTCAGGIIRTSLAKQHQFKKGLAMGEDTLFMFQVCKDAKISVDTPSKYYYVKNTESATKKASSSATAKNAEESLAAARKHFSDNLVFLNQINIESPDYKDIIKTAAASKAYDALDIYISNPKIKRKDYIKLCEEFNKIDPFDCRYLANTAYSKSKQIGMKLLAAHRYSFSYYYNRLKKRIRTT